MLARSLSTSSSSSRSVKVCDSNGTFIQIFAVVDVRFSRDNGSSICSLCLSISLARCVIHVTLPSSLHFTFIIYCYRTFFLGALSFNPQMSIRLSLRALALAVKRHHMYSDIR